MKLFYTILSFLFLITNIQAQEFIDMQLVKTYSKAELSTLVSFPFSYDVELYKVRYTTVDLNGEQINVSGLLGKPVSEKLLHPSIIYCHGTSSSREDVPSRLNFEHVPVSILAGIGMVVLAPDYVGQGDSELLHPYLHADTEASASYDMYRAIKENEEVHKLETNDQLFVIGISQGGHASMATHKYIDTAPNIPYEVSGAAHLFGPYSMSQANAEFTLGDTEFSYTGYITQIFMSYEAAYGDILGEKGLETAFKEPYVSVMKQFEKEEIDLDQLNTQLSQLLIENHGASKLKFMMKDSMINAIFNVPESTIKQALVRNDVFDFAPTAPTRLYYCSGDERVTFLNSTIAEAKMKENGAADVAAFDLGPDKNHVECITPSLTLSIFFFSGLIDLVSSAEDLYVQEGIAIFPNPSSDYFVLRDEKNVSGNIRVIDMMGRTIINKSYNSGNTLDISLIPSGNYIVHWKTEDYNSIHKLMVSN